MMAGRGHCYSHAIINFLAIFSLIAGCHASDFSSRFWVSNGTGPIRRSGGGNYGGSCYGIDADLHAIYLEAIEMAEVALTALNDYANSPTVHATVQSFWGIEPNDGGTGVLAAHVGSFNYVIDSYSAVVEFAHESRGGDIMPGFFCDDSWAWKTKQFYNGSGDVTDQKLADRYPDYHEEMRWAPLYKDYIRRGLQCTGTTLAYMTYRFQSITMCPYSFSYPRRKDSLKPWRSGEKEVASGQKLTVTMSTPGTVLHELMHLTSDGDITDLKAHNAKTGSEDVAYTPSLVMELARQKTASQAIRNADTYRWFANAMYLDSCDWSRGECAQAVSTATITARSNHTSLYAAHAHGHATGHGHSHGRMKRRQHFLDGILDAPSI
ncbi:hypothetical protein BDW69DRAFT_204885 [Aspergillus filifer]